LFFSLTHSSKWPCWLPYVNVHRRTHYAVIVLSVRQNPALLSPETSRSCAVMELFDASIHLALLLSKLMPVLYRFFVEIIRVIWVMLM
jgi:hypothetical protein